MQVKQDKGKVTPRMGHEGKNSPTLSLTSALDPGGVPCPGRFISGKETRCVHCDRNRTYERLKHATLLLCVFFCRCYQSEETAVMKESRT